MRPRTAFLLGSALLAATAASTQDRPENLLPDIFEEEAPPPEEAPPSRAPQPLLPDDRDAAPGPVGPTDIDDLFADEFGLAPVAAPPPRPTYDALGTEQRMANMSRVGPLTPARGGYGARTFNGTNGPLFAAWMKRIDTPLASRWAHIVLRRALLSDAPTPEGVRDADWVAARALLLTRMGEADGAKLLLQNLPLDRFTPRLYSVASQAHLAGADVTGLCPLAPTARAISDDLFWDLATGICAGLDGDDVTARTRFNQLRGSDDVEAVNLLLAERITALAGEGDRAANVDWTGVRALDATTFGLAAASGTALPENLRATNSAALNGWIFRAHGLSLEERAAAGLRAAEIGIASARELGALEAVRAERIDASEEVPDSARLLRTAYTGRTAAERVSAVRSLVDRGQAAGSRYGALLLVGGAAADIGADPDLVADAPLLIEAMLAAGRIQAALSWWPVLETADESLRMRIWPMLALVDPAAAIPKSASFARAAFRALSQEDEASARRTLRWLIAGMQGLGAGEGREWVALADDFGVGARQDIHVDALARAASRRQKGEVAVLAALGLQAPWARVAPEDLTPVLSALQSVGLATEARLMAVEALSRGA